MGAGGGVALATGATSGALASGLGAGAALGAFALRAAGAGSFRCCRLASAGAGRARAGLAVAGSWLLRVVHGGSPGWLDDGMSSMDGVSTPRRLLDSHLRRTVCASAGPVAQVDRVDRATSGAGLHQLGGRSLSVESTIRSHVQTKPARIATADRKPLVSGAAVTSTWPCRSP